MKQLIIITICAILSLNVFAQPYAFLFKDGTYSISSSPFEYSERVARLNSFQILTQQNEVIYEKADWAIKAEQLFYQGMVINGFGEPPWTNQTFESVGIELLTKSVNGSTEEERNNADRWKGVLESSFNSLLQYYNSYRKQFNETEITAIWDYPLNSNIIFSNNVTQKIIIYQNKAYVNK